MLEIGWIILHNNPWLKKEEAHLHTMLKKAIHHNGMTKKGMEFHCKMVQKPIFQCGNFSSNKAYTKHQN